MNNLRYLVELPRKLRPHGPTTLAGMPVASAMVQEIADGLGCRSRDALDFIPYPK